MEVSVLELESASANPRPHFFHFSEGKEGADRIPIYANVALYPRTVGPPASQYLFRLYKSLEKDSYTDRATSENLVKKKKKRSTPPTTSSGGGPCGYYAITASTEIYLDVD